MSAAKNFVPFLTKALQVSSQHGGLDQALHAVKVVSASPGRAKFSLVVDESHANMGGTMHGGFSAHLVDSLTTLAQLTVGEDPKPGVSVDMHITYMKPAKIGEEIFIEASSIRTGRTLAFLECEIKNKDNVILVKGAHTKFVG